MFISTEQPYELHELNQHLEGSSYYNHILDAFESLRLYDDVEPADFAEFGFHKWKPANHIYAIGKVVEEKPHEVFVNSYGKLIFHKIML